MRLEVLCCVLTRFRVSWCVCMCVVTQCAIGQLTDMLVVGSLVADWLQAVPGNGLAPIVKNSPRHVDACHDVS